MSERQTLGVPTIVLPPLQDPAMRSALQHIAQQTQTWLRRIAQAHDELQGNRGTPQLRANLDAGGNRLTNLAAPAGDADAVRADLALRKPLTTSEYFDTLGLTIQGLPRAATERQAVPLEQLQELIQETNLIANSSFVTVNAEAALSFERQLLAEAGVLLLTDAGANTTLTVSVVANGISNAKLRTSGALAVVGRAANSTGNVADIQATAASDAVLRESGSTLAFGTLATAGLANNAVSDAKLRQGAATTVIGRSAGSTGNVADIAASADTDVLRRSGGTLGFGQITTAYHSDYVSSTFTATGTGFTAGVSSTARYVKLGIMVWLWFDVLTGTSNATTFTITGLPAAIQPTRISHHYVLGQDNGASTRVLMKLNAGSTTIDLYAADGVVWTAANGKSLYECWVCYALV